MGSDTMEATDITPTDTEQVFFSSIHPNYRLLRAPTLEVTNAVGQKQVVSPGLSYEFDEDGYFRVTDKIRERDAAFFARYGNNYDLMDQAPAEDWLRQHPRFGAQKGFVEIEAVTPPSAQTLLEITNALVEGDSDRLVAIYEQEEEHFKRADVLEAATNAMHKLEEDATREQAHADELAAAKADPAPSDPAAGG